MTDNIQIELNKGLDEISNTIKAIKGFKGDVDGKLEVTTKAVQEANNNIEVLTKKCEEANNRIKDMELEIVENKSYSNNRDDIYRNKDVINFTKALTLNNRNEVQKTLGNVSFNQAAGGYLVPELLANKIIEPVFNEGSTELMSLPNTMAVKAKEVKIPVENTLPVPYRRGECQEAGYSNSSFSKLELSPNSLSCIIRQSWEFMNYQNLYTPQKMVSDLRNSYTATIANEVINGNGNNRYLGILEAEGVTEHASIDSNKIGLKDLKAMLAKLKIGYKPTFVMHRTTWWYLQSLEDSMGRPLINTNVPAGIASTLLGYPVVVVGDIFIADPNKQVPLKNGKTINQGSFKPLIGSGDIDNQSQPFASGSFPIILGDFKIGYTQLIAQDLFILPDPYTEGGSNCMKWYFHMYNDGMPTMPEAFVKLKIS